MHQCAGTFISPALNYEGKDLRDKLHHEIENKSRACSNPTYECTVPRIEGFEYCQRHILRDPRGTAYRQCTHVFGNGKKCPNAVLKQDPKKDSTVTTLCFEHSRNAQLLKTRASIGRFRRVETNEALLHSLSHHINIEEPSPERDNNASCSEQDVEIDVVSPNVTPFVCHDQIHSLSHVNVSLRKRPRILDYASDSFSDEEEPATLTNTSRSIEYNESSDESVDSQEEDYLKHAGVYSSQEALRITESKLQRLQGLYIDQINRLHHVLKDRRRRYLNAMRKEREILCTIHDQFKETPRERALYEQLKALNAYHRRQGVEAVLYKKFKDKRARTSEPFAPKGPGFSKCIYTEGGVKCGDRALPCCKYCRKHILEDKKQILFRACNVEKSGVVCQEPIPDIMEDANCVLHMVVPSKRLYTQKKYESETEEEESIVKSEAIDTTQNEGTPT